MKKNFQLMAFALLFTACGGNKQELIKEDSATNTIKVRTETVKTANGNSSFHYSGTVEASQTIPLSFQTTGTVEKVMVQEGDMVHKGEVLATIIKGNSQSMYNAAKAKFQQAQDAYDRLKSVHNKGSLTELKWIEMETNLKQAESQLQIAQSSMDDCTLKAPDNGMIGRRNIEPGQSSISVNSPFELVKIETVLVKIAVPENEISKIHKGQTATFSLSALDGKTFEGMVSNVGIVADMISRTYEVKISVKNTNLEIKPGMVCDVFLNTGTQTEMVVVPYNAVSKDNEGNTFVYLVSKDGKSVKRQIILVGNYQNTGIEVRSGLIPNQMVVVNGKEKLSDNSLISI